MVWSRRLKVFHWLNAILVIHLAILGSILMFAEDLGFKLTESVEDFLVNSHIVLGIFFILNLSYRLYYMISSKDHGESISEVNPFSKENIKQLRSHSSNSPSYKYHNPIGRFMVFGWFIILIIQVITGIDVAIDHFTISEELASHEESEFHELHEIIFFTIIAMLVLHISGAIQETKRTGKSVIKKILII